VFDDGPDGGFYCAGQADITDDQDRQGVILCAGFALALGIAAIGYAFSCISALQRGFASDIPMPLAWAILVSGVVIMLLGLTFGFIEAAHWDFKNIGPGHLAGAGLGAAGSLALVGLVLLDRGGINPVTLSSIGVAAALGAVSLVLSLAARARPHLIGRKTEIQRALIVDTMQPDAAKGSEGPVVKMQMDDGRCLNIRATPEAFSASVPGAVGPATICGAVMVKFQQVEFRPDLRDAARQVGSQS
jgi:hypothetical protein